MKYEEILNASAIVLADILHKAVFVTWIGLFYFH